MRRIMDLSRLVHDLIWNDASQSLCARAWEKQGRSIFWRAWVRIFGPNHCQSSWDWHRRRNLK